MKTPEHKSGEMTVHKDNSITSDKKPSLLKLSNKERKALKASAKELIKLGYSVFAVDSNKEPTELSSSGNVIKTSWSKFKETPASLSNIEKWFANPFAYGIAIICGKGSGTTDSKGKKINGFESIDLDCKYDQTGTLFQRFKNAVIAYSESLWQSLVIETTVNGGYHISYRCYNYERCQHLAYSSDGKLIIETRGQNPKDLTGGGYIVAAPSKGYSLIQGSYKYLPYISIEDRNKLIDICRSLSEIEPENPNPTKRLARTPKIDFKAYSSDSKALIDKLLPTWINNAISPIKKAHDGSKHNALLKSANTMGGYVGAGAISYDDAFNMLENAVAQKPDIKSMSKAKRTIRDGLNHGIKSPFDLEAKLQSRGLESAKKARDNHYKIPKGLKVHDTGAIDQLLSDECKDSRILLHAPPGSGKTFATLMSTAKQAKEKGLKTLFLFPLRSLTAQVQETYRQLGIRCVIGGSTQEQIEEASSSLLIGSTYDSYNKLSLNPSDIDLLVIDESHNVEIQYSFRKEAIDKLWMFGRQCKKVLAISATPPELFQFVGFKPYKFEMEENPQISLHRFDIKKGSGEDKCIENLLENGFNDGLTIVKHNNIGGIQTIKESLVRASILKDNEIVTIHTKEELETDPDYLSILEEERLRDDVKLLLTTAKINDGVNLLNSNISAIHIINERSVKAFRQFIARPRSMKSLTVYSYRSIANERDKKGLKGFNQEWIIKRLIQGASSVAKSKNYQRDIMKDMIDFFKKDIVKGTHDHVFFNTFTEQWEVNECAILYDVSSKIDSMKTVDEFYTELLKKAPYYSIVSCSVVNAQKTKLTQEVKEAIKEEKQRKQTGIIELMAINTKLFLSALYFVVKDRVLKGMIEGFIGYEPHLNDDLNSFIESNFDLLSYRFAERAGGTFLRLVQYGFKAASIIELMKDEKFLGRENIRHFTRFISMHSMFYAFKCYQHEIISPKVYRQLNIVDKDFKTLDGFIGKYASSEELLNALNKNRKKLADKLTKKQLSELIALGFKFTKVKRTKAKTIHYLIEERLNRSDFMNKHNLSDDDFLNNLDYKISQRLGIEQLSTDLGGEGKSFISVKSINSAFSTSTNNRKVILPYEGYCQSCGF